MNNEQTNWDKFTHSISLTYHLLYTNCKALFVTVLWKLIHILKTKSSWLKILAFWANLFDISKCFEYSIGSMEWRRIKETSHFKRQLEQQLEKGGNGAKKSEKERQIRGEKEDQKRQNFQNILSIVFSHIPWSMCYHPVHWAKIFAMYCILIACSMTITFYTLQHLIGFGSIFIPFDSVIEKKCCYLFIIQVGNEIYVCQCRLMFWWLWIERRSWDMNTEWYWGYQLWNIIIMTGKYWH